MMTTVNDTDRDGVKVRWRIKDVIDLEYFLHGDSHPEDENGSSSYAPKARSLYLARLRHLSDDGSVSARRLLVRRWLDIRREGETMTLPGSIYTEASRILLMVAAVLGLGAGISLALSLLDYSGVQPLNVSIYMGVAVFSQILLLFLLVVIFAFRTAGRSLVRSSVLAGLLGRGISAAILKARKGTLDRLDGQKREALAAVAGLLRGRKQVYGSLFFWPVFILTQVFAVCFNAGLLGATLAKLSGSDVAFGWQSTFQIGDRAVFHLVEALALPWRWMMPPSLAYPTLEAIKGSHIILKDGLAAFDTPDLVAWWPFLCLSVLFYGLLPRLVLLISGIFIRQHLLARLRFDHSACNRLVRTMTRPAFSTAGVPVAAPGRDFGGAAPSSAAGKKVHGHGGYVALVPEDIRADCEGLEDIVARALAIRVTERKTINTNEADDQAVFDALAVMESTPDFAGVLVLQEAWQPPIQENLNYLKTLRRRLGKTVGIVVGLIGKPEPDTLFTAPREENVRIWKQRVDALGDPYLGVERLVSHD